MSREALADPSALSVQHRSMPWWVRLFRKEGQEIRKCASCGAICICAALLVIQPQLIAAEPVMVTSVAAMALFLALWMSKTVPDYVAAALFFVVLAIVGDVPDASIFAGFKSHAVWLVFGGLIIAVAIRKCGLGNRIASLLLRGVGSSYLALIAGIIFLANIMVFIVPSAVARMMLLLPIITAVAETAGFAKGSNGRDGMLCAGLAGTMLGSYGVLTGGIPPIVMFGSAKTLYDITFSYSHYMLANFPVLTVLTAAALIGLICSLFPARVSGIPDSNQRRQWTRDERTMFAILALTLILWFADGVHGISPAWIGLVAALLCLVPRIGPARGTTISEGVDFGVWFMLAAFVSLGAVMKESGFGTALGNTLVDLLRLHPGNDFWNFAGIVGINHLINLGTTQMSSPAIMAALAQPIAAAIQWPIESVLMVQAAAWPMPLLPYEIPMMAITLGMGGVTMARATKLLMALAAVGVAVILPAQFLWLAFLGIIP